jgi:hypothetical protein
MKLLDARLSYNLYVSINNLLFTIVLSVIPRFTDSDYPFVYSNSTNVWHYSVYLYFPFNDIYVIICYIEYLFPWWQLDLSQGNIFHTQTSHQIIMCLKYKKDSSVLSCAFTSMAHHNRKQLLLRNTASVMFE